MYNNLCARRGWVSSVDNSLPLSRETCMYNVPILVFHIFPKHKYQISLYCLREGTLFTFRFDYLQVKEFPVPEIYVL